ncbi:MAG: oxidoreductase [Marmoricola sp.]|jgi:hypothetical protein|nr:oxidoreductase [Marmoricola sp.]
MERNLKLDAERPGISAKEYVSRAALKRMVTVGEVASAVVATLHMSGMSGTDVDLSADMIAR